MTVRLNGKVKIGEECFVENKRDPKKKITTELIQREKKNKNEPFQTVNLLRFTSSCLV